MISPGVFSHNREDVVRTTEMLLVLAVVQGKERMPEWQRVHSGGVSHRQDRMFDAFRSSSGGVVRGASQAFAIGRGQDDIVVMSRETSCEVPSP